MRRLLLTIVLLTLTILVDAQDVRLPMKQGSVKFAVIGDTGTGDKNEISVANELFAAHGKFPFGFVLMMGDNVYGSDKPSDMVAKFDRPYKPLLDAGVKFYAVLGNHDDPSQRFYKPFNMNGGRYYTYRPSLTGGVRFFALDSNYVDPAQLAWFEKELMASSSDWKIAFFHHPLYASGMHGSDMILQSKLEPLFIKYGVNVVFTGHEHFYERIKPQKGVQYFVLGNSAKLRKGDITKTSLTAFGYDTGYAFMLVEITGDELNYQVISNTGQTIDSGIVRKDANTSSVIGTAGTKPAAPAGRGAAPPKQ